MDSTGAVPCTHDSCSKGDSGTLATPSKVSCCNLQAKGNIATLQMHAHQQNTGCEYLAWMLTWLDAKLLLSGVAHVQVWQPSA